MQKDYKLTVTLPEGHETLKIDIEMIIYGALKEKLKKDGVNDEVLADVKKFNVNLNFL